MPRLSIPPFASEFSNLGTWGWPMNNEKNKTANFAFFLFWPEMFGLSDLPSPACLAFSSSTRLILLHVLQHRMNPASEFPHKSTCRQPASETTPPKKSQIHRSPSAQHQSAVGRPAAGGLLVVLYRFRTTVFTFECSKITRNASTNRDE